ncbi:MAG: hypothetical protein PHX08_14855 [Lachnospiraceae bacterium]|nr:hypothetical protein [Lachnospiraceae bacterium]
MNWITKLERKFGKYAIHNLMYYIIILQGIGFAMTLVAPNFYNQYLSLDASAILQGQVWRVFTFLIQPPSTSLLFIIFALYLYYMIGQSLEASWGAFRFNLYFFAGVLFHILAAILTYIITGLSLPLGTVYLNLSLFFAFAALYPDVQFLLFFIIPVKVKYLAWFNGAFFGFTILQGILPSYTKSEYGLSYQANAIAAFVSILNFAIFYLSSRNMKPYSPKEIRRKNKFKRETTKAKTPYTTSYGNGAKHRCVICGRTEIDDPHLEFRYCSKCKGNHEYCQDHLFTHEHVK